MNYRVPSEIDNVYCIFCVSASLLNPRNDYTYAYFYVVQSTVLYCLHIRISLSILQVCTSGVYPVGDNYFYLPRRASAKVDKCPAYDADTEH